MYEMETEEEERGGLRGLKTWWQRWTERGEDDEFEPGDEREERPRAAFSHGSAATTPAAAPSSTPTFRLATVRDSAITIMPAATFDDMQRAADRLKRGEPQIINLESTDPDMAERLIDFLNGVTYALDGCVEKVAEGAYLFTPANIAIRSDGSDTGASSPRSFLNR